MISERLKIKINQIKRVRVVPGAASAGVIRFGSETLRDKLPSASLCDRLIDPSKRK